MSIIKIDNEEVKSIFQKGNILLILFVVASSALLAAINYYTIKTTSAVRAYVNGESRYSKGQKDASRHLITYLTLQDDEQYRLFNDELNVPLGDSLARVGLSTHGTYESIRTGFLQGKNHVDDVDDMIWLFKNFSEVSFMKQAITIWKEADVVVGQLKMMGDGIKVKMQAGEITAAEKKTLIRKIEVITTQLTLKERAFSDLLGATARTINLYAFFINFIISLLIISCVVAYSYKGIRQLMRAHHDLKQTNKNLNETNIELDNFVYAASHDLKSPVTNLEGLIRLLKRESTPSSMQQDLLEKMDYTIASLRKTIIGLTEVMKTDKSPMNDVQENVFKNLVEEFTRENQYLPEETDSQIITTFLVEKINYSTAGLKSILQNLLTNAFKYRSPDKKCVIHIKTELSEGKVLLEVSDNGLGIDLERNGHKLFKMFTRLHANHVEGTGLGLYLIKRIIERHGGSIKAESKPGIGSRFIVTLN